MKLSFSHLNKVYFTISNLFAVRQLGKGKKKFTMQNPRPTDALLLFSGASGICYQENKPPLYIPHGALVYVPKNSRYMWEDSPVTDDNILEKMLFEFTLYRIETSKDLNNKISITDITEDRIVLGDKITIIATDFLSYHKKSFESLIEAFDNQNNSFLGVYSKAYELFNVVSGVCTIQENNMYDIKVIEKGIKYIEENPCVKKSIKEIADLCGVCVGYFERIFKNHFNITPIEYININKILHIKKMLQVKEKTLDEIAETIGYCDSAYLCRIFKKKTGMTPKEYRRLYFSSINSNSIF